MADSQERQLILTETISKKLDEIIERQRKLEDENVRLRKENENLKAPSRREKAPRRRRSKVLTPDDLPVSNKLSNYSVDIKTAHSTGRSLNM